MKEQLEEAGIKAYGSIEIELIPKTDNNGDEEGDRLFLLFEMIQHEILSLLESAVFSDDFNFRIKE